MGKNLANPAQLVHKCLTFKISAGKILAGLDKFAKSAKIFHHQNFALYGMCLIAKCWVRCHGFIRYIGIA